MSTYSRPAIFLDDAAISFRYAERLATGRGFTYNDHEHVLGASDPLYVIVLAVPAAAGLSAEAAATFVGTSGYVLCVFFVVLLAARFGGAVGGIAAALAVTGDEFFRFQALNGMEVGLALALGMGAIAALADDRQVLAGVLAGLALWNKLDGAALVLAVVVADAVHRRRVPARLLAACAATCAPWFLWATWYFGSPIPQSLTTKLAGGERQPFDSLWFVRFLADGWRRYALVLAPLAFAVRRAGPPPELRRAGSAPGSEADPPVTALALWALLHALAYSLVDLGAPYPWYLAVPIAPLATLLGIAIGSAWTALQQHAPRRPLAYVTLVIGAMGVLASVLGSPRWWQPRGLVSWEALEVDRRELGVFLRENARPGEVLDSSFGWPAFESRLPVNDPDGLNSVTRLAPVAY